MVRCPRRNGVLSATGDVIYSTLYSMIETEIGIEIERCTDVRVLGYRPAIAHHTLEHRRADFAALLLLLPSLRRRRAVGCRLGLTPKRLTPAAMSWSRSLLAPSATASRRKKCCRDGRREVVGIVRATHQRVGWRLVQATESAGRADSVALAQGRSAPTSALTRRACRSRAQRRTCGRPHAVWCSIRRPTCPTLVPIVPRRTAVMKGALLGRLVAACTTWMNWACNCVGNGAGRHKITPSSGSV